MKLWLYQRWLQIRVGAYVLLAGLVVLLLMHHFLAPPDWCSGAGIPDDIACYSISVKDQDLQLIDEYIQGAKTYLPDDRRVFVYGIFRDKHTVTPIELRVRGDQSNHWAHAKKSWRVHFLDPNAHNGEPEINLILPDDRAWFNALLNRRRALSMGFVQPDVRPAVVYINGVGPQFYLEVEHWSREMLERQRVTGDVYLYKEQFSTYLYKDIAYWDAYVDAESVEQPTMEGVEELMGFSEANRYNAPDFLPMVDLFFDRKELVNWYVQSLLAGNLHVVDDNVRVFFDLSLGKFHPIPWDVMYRAHETLLLPPGNPLWNQIFAHPVMRLAVQRALWAYVHTEEELQKDFDLVEYWAPHMESIALRDPIKAQTNDAVKADIADRLQQVYGNVRAIQAELSGSTVRMRHYNSGHGPTIEFVVEGSVIDVITGIHVAQPGAYRLVRDNGDGVYSSQDTVIPTSVEDGVIKPGNEDSALLWPRAIEQPALDDPERITETTPHRLFLIGPAAFVQVDVRNAVTGDPITLLSMP